jgi:hypothetical protein
MAAFEDAEFREALDRSARVVAGLPELLQPSAFAVVFPFIYAPPSGVRVTRASRRARTPVPGPTRRQSSGPKPAIERLLAEGFFGSPRTVDEVGTAIKDARGQAFEGRMLSTALLRMVRARILDRSRTPAGGYAYVEANTHA